VSANTATLTARSRARDDRGERIDAAEMELRVALRDHRGQRVHLEKVSAAGVVDAKVDAADAADAE
jgi:hypothetical protein